MFKRKKSKELSFKAKLASAKPARREEKESTDLSKAYVKAYNAFNTLRDNVAAANSDEGFIDRELGLTGAPEAKLEDNLLLVESLQTLLWAKGFLDGAESNLRNIQALESATGAFASQAQDSLKELKSKHEKYLEAINQVTQDINQATAAFLDARLLELETRKPDFESGEFSISQETLALRQVYALNPQKR